MYADFRKDHAIAHNVFLMSARSAKRKGGREQQADELPEVPIPPEVEALSIVTPPKVTEALAPMAVMFAPLEELYFKPSFP